MDAHIFGLLKAMHENHRGLVCADAAAERTARALLDAGLIYEDSTIRHRGRTVPLYFLTVKGADLAEAEATADIAPVNVEITTLGALEKQSDEIQLLTDAPEWMLR